MIEKPLVYLETSFISHLTARKSSDALYAARQQSSKQWWDDYRDRYRLIASVTVHEECRQGDPIMAARRLSIANVASLMPADSTILDIAGTLIEPFGPLPAKASTDAVHIASASLHGCDFLLTWNFRHLANAVIRRRIERILKDHGYEISTICTPDQLMA